jgi:two-component system nitrate/nitrite response regulator NarL
LSGYRLSPIRVFLVGRVRLYRESLALALGQAPSLEVVGGAGEWREGLGHVRASSPDIVLLDMTVPGSLEAAAAILGLRPAPRVVAMALADGEEDVLACAEAGISGYITSTDSIPVAIDAIESVARGELLTTPRLAAALLQRIRSLATASTSAAAARLTPREREIAALLADGHTNKEIALRLGIEPTTVKNHVHNILEKLQVRRRTEAAQRVRAELIATPPPDGPGRD